MILSTTNDVEHTGTRFYEKKSAQLFNLLSAGMLSEVVLSVFYAERHYAVFHYAELLTVRLSTIVIRVSMVGVVAPLMYAYASIF